MLLRLKVRETTVSSVLHNHCDQVLFFVLTLVGFGVRENWVAFIADLSFFHAR